MADDEPLKDKKTLINHYYAGSPLRDVGHNFMKHIHIAAAAACFHAPPFRHPLYSRYIAPYIAPARRGHLPLLSFGLSRLRPLAHGFSPNLLKHDVTNDDGAGRLDTFMHGFPVSLARYKTYDLISPSAHARLLCRR